MRPGSAFSADPALGVLGLEGRGDALDHESRLVESRDQITPELVLVDPMLRARLQAQALLEHEQLEARPKPFVPVLVQESAVSLRATAPASPAIAPSPHEAGREEPSRHAGLIAS